VLLIVIISAKQRVLANAATTTPVVAVTTIDDVRGDSSIAWLRAGLPRMIAGDLDAMGGIEVVAPTRVRDVLVRLTGSALPRITEDQSLDVARRLGASWVVRGGVSEGKNGYLLDITIQNVASSAETQNFTELSRNPIDLGRMTASRLAALLNVAPANTGPRFSGIETMSPEAYRHFIRGALASEAEQLVHAAQELDAAIALDSGFVIAVRYRRGVARALGDEDTYRRLAPLEARFIDRLPEFDRLADEVRNLDSLGEHERASALSERILARFPHDPRGYNLRADVLAGQGKWAPAESVLVHELALDSLAISAGDGPCTPCEVLWKLSQTRLVNGNRAGAEETVRRWVALQPDLPGTWRSLAATLAMVGTSSEAVAAGFHYVALSSEPPALVEFARIAIIARRLDIADSLVRTWRGSTDPVLMNGARDIQSILLRERGDFAGSAVVLSRLPSTDGLTLIRADDLARTGRLAQARAIYELTGHPRGVAPNAQFTPSEARGYTWSHALEADALARAGDTTAARAFIDSLASSGRQSYYVRDKLLYHHALGSLYLAEGKLADAEREFRAALWMAGGWTRTNVELARTQIAERRPRDAIATLRDAYLAPLDAMGRYVPRSELDWWMSRAFAAAGDRDSAATYARFVKKAWNGVDRHSTIAAVRIP
jgi:tetratricopeptide (TPR) repeat protein